MLDFELEARKSLESLNKAIDRGTLDDAMLIQTIDPILPFMHIKENPLLMLVPDNFHPGRGYYWNQATEGNTPSEFTAETGSPTEDTPSFELQSALYKIQTSKGKVYRFARETGADFRDLLMDALEIIMIGFWDLMEKQMIQGTVSSTEPAGLFTLLPASQTIHNSTDSGGAFFDEMALMEAIELAKAKPESGYIVSSSRVWLQMNSIVLASKRATQDIMIKGGAIVPTYQNVPWFKSTNVLNTMTFDGSSTTSLAGATCSEIYIGNKNFTKRKYLRPPSYFPIPMNTAMYDEFELLSYWVFAITNYLYCSRVDGIDTTNISE